MTVVKIKKIAEKSSTAKKFYLQHALKINSYNEHSSPLRASLV